MNFANAFQSYCFKK